MSDQDKREKVIKGLECCIPYESEGNEHLCIYDDDYNQNCPYRGTGSYGASCMTILMRDALALLKAQEARHRLEVHNIGNVDVPEGVTWEQFQAVMSGVVKALEHTDRGESWPYDEDRM